MQKQEQHSLLSRPQENSHHPCCVCSSWTLILLTCLWSWKLWVISEDNIRLKAAQWRCAMFWLFLETITIPYPEWGSFGHIRIGHKSRCSEAKERGIHSVKSFWSSTRTVPVPWIQRLSGRRKGWKKFWEGKEHVGERLNFDLAQYSLREINSLNHPSSPVLRGKKHLGMKWN